MALNVQTFKTRALTALIFVAVMLVGLLWNLWSFVVLFTIIHFGCWYEFVKLVRKIKPANDRWFDLLGLIYLTAPYLMMLDLGTEVLINTADNTSKYLYSPVIPCGIVFSIWINDTMAYLVGSFIGKTPFSKISPKKTWEGTIGGAVLCVVTIALLARAIPAAHIISVTHWAVIAALCAVFGTTGDLLESKLKRLANVKDSGSFMPGHGGFLDRFDSLLIAVPAVWLFIYFFS